MDNPTGVKTGQAVVIFVSEKRRAAFNQWRLSLRAQSISSVFALNLNTLGNTLQAHRDSKDVTVVIADEDLKKSEEIVAESQIPDVKVVTIYKP